MIGFAAASARTHAPAAAITNTKTKRSGRFIILISALCYLPPGPVDSSCSQNNGANCEVLQAHIKRGHQTQIPLESGRGLPHSTTLRAARERFIIPTGLGVRFLPLFA